MSTSTHSSDVLGWINQRILNLINQKTNFMNTRYPYNHEYDNLLDNISIF